MQIKGIKLQNSLGRLEGFYRNDMRMGGFMGVARVLKVHHKTGTADVMLVNSKDTYVSSENNEGKFSARILQRSANFSDERQRYWGTIDPIAEGSLVLLAFLESMKHRPIILGSFHNPDNIDNILPEQYPLKEKEAGYDRREALKKLTVSPSLGYRKEDGEGNIEVSFGSRSFFAMYNTSLDEMGNLSDNHGGFDHEDLSEIDKRTNEPISADWPEAQAPSKFLFVHRSAFDKDSATWTKFFINEQGRFRITRDNNDEKLSYFEMEETGGARLRRQVDSPNHGESEDYAELDVDANGNAILRRVTGDTVSEIGVSEGGNARIAHSSGSVFDMGENLELEVTGEIFSNSLSRFIEKNHIVVSDTEPENPIPFLIWVDTSKD
jgi:hypothetical protein